MINNFLFIMSGHRHGSGGGGFCVPRLTKPCIVGYMSVDIHRQYHADLSQLKYVTYIPQGKVKLDLNHNVSKAVKRTTVDNEEKITLLLRFMLDQGRRLGPPTMPKMHFITNRRVLINVMSSAFNIKEPVDIEASLYKGAIYLCGIQSAEHMERDLQAKREHKFCAWGYKFEQYLTADAPSSKPDIDKPVIENEEFSLCYHATLGKHELLYMAQIDGMLATDNSVPNPPLATDVEANLNYLRGKSYVELKTNREIESKRQEYNLKRIKLLHCWGQCYLAGLSGLLVGFRDDYGIVNRVQWFSTDDIVDYCRNVWDPQEALEFLDSFLSFVKSCLKENMLKHCRNHETPTYLKLRIDKDKSFKVVNEENNDFVILPEWYINTN